MDWLTQNWVWVALAIGAGFYFLRGGLGGHAGAHRFESAPQEYARNAAGHSVRPVEAANERPRRRRGC